MPTKATKPKGSTAREVGRLIDNLDPKSISKVPAGFSLWSTSLQAAWLRVHQRRHKITVCKGEGYLLPVSLTAAQCRAVVNGLLRVVDSGDSPHVRAARQVLSLLEVKHGR